MFINCRHILSLVNMFRTLRIYVTLFFSLTVFFSSSAFWILTEFWAAKRKMWALEKVIFIRTNPQMGEMCVLGWHINLRPQTQNTELEDVFSDCEKRGIRLHWGPLCTITLLWGLTDHWKANLYSVEIELVLFEIVECMGQI